MVKAIYSDKKGIYKDLYRTIHEQNNEEQHVKRQRKGIYANLYRQLKEDKQNVAFKGGQEKKEKINPLILFKNIFNKTVSQSSCFFSSAAGEIKVLILACMVAKRPVNNYIENKLPVYFTQENQGHYNDR